jgi:tetratricopeptide (TPR) repeat protein
MINVRLLAPMLAALLTLSHARPAPAQLQHPAAATPVADLLTSYVDWIEGRRPSMQMIVLDLDAARNELGRIAPVFLSPLEGIVEALKGTCPSVTFTLGGVPISTNAQTTFDSACGQLSNFSSVKVLRRIDPALPSERVTLLAAEPSTPEGVVSALRAPAKLHAYDNGHRRLLATFALDLAAAGSRRQAAAAARLVEWACPYIRNHTPLDDFDRAWQLAALSVIEGGISARALGLHLDHATPVFGPEPRLLLAEGIAEEATTAPTEVINLAPASGRTTAALQQRSQAEGERQRAAERAIVRFREAMKNEQVRAEASLRLGHVQLVLRRYDDAIASWSGVESATNDPAILYLLHLFRGMAYEGSARAHGAFATDRSNAPAAGAAPDASRPDATSDGPASAEPARAGVTQAPAAAAALARARESYRKALEISPGAHSATIRLAALTFRTGRRDEPDRLLEKLFTDDDPRRDPWWSYYAADWRFWYPRIERVRAMIAK